MKESCALCKSEARIYCESDKAMLCWTCDAKVHSANFLVAKHCRCLLCHVCQSQTPWSASGEKLGRTVSVCERCVDNCHRVKEEEDENDEIESEGDYDADDNEDESEDDDDVDLDLEDEEEENQVVPWSSVSPPPSPCSSSSRDCRRIPADDFPDLSSDEDLECLSSEAPDEEETEIELAIATRPLKVRKIEAEGLFDDDGHRSVALIESLNRLHEEDMNPSEKRICRSRFRLLL